MTTTCANCGFTTAGRSLFCPRCSNLILGGKKGAQPAAPGLAAADPTSAPVARSVLAPDWTYEELLEWYGLIGLAALALAWFQEHGKGLSHPVFAGEMMGAALGVLGIGTALSVLIRLVNRSARKRRTIVNCCLVLLACQVASAAEELVYPRQSGSSPVTDVSRATQPPDPAVAQPAPVAQVAVVPTPRLSNAVSPAISQPDPSEPLKSPPLASASILAAAPGPTLRPDHATRNATPHAALATATPKRVSNGVAPIAAPRAPLPDTDVADRSPAYDPAFANAKPRYPTWAKAHMVGATVTLLILVNESGEVENLHVEQSSGDTDLDAAAESAVYGWHFIPGKKDGNVVKSWVRIPVTFSQNVF